MNKLEQFKLISAAAEKFNKGQHIKPSVESSFMEGAYWASETILRGVLEWLDENIEIVTDSDDNSFVCLSYFCDTKAEVLQLFKERFNIE